MSVSKSGGAMAPVPLNSVGLSKNLLNSKPMDETFTS